MPGEKVSLRKPIIKLATAKKGSRQAHMPDVNVKIMKTGMLSDYAVIQKLSRRLYNLAKNAKEIKVVTDAGTFIVAEFSSKIKWIISDGDITKRVMRWGNLPSGEVYTSPLNVNGVFVVDGVLGDWLGPKYGSMERQPLKLTIKNSRVVNAECRNKKLLAEFNDYIRQDSNANRIGEFAIGTNIGLKKLIGEIKPYGTRISYKMTEPTLKKDLSEFSRICSENGIESF
ncbi:aminopeptidase, partial [Candidatus Woesearchaeota archaeon]|nr:aminopeptidase [Candidatus Woesearchaeota archaeon]